MPILKLLMMPENLYGKSESLSIAKSNTQRLIAKTSQPNNTLTLQSNNPNKFNSWQK